MARMVFSIKKIMNSNGATTVVPNSQKKPTWPGQNFANQTIPVVVIIIIIIIIIIVIVIIIVIIIITNITTTRLKLIQAT